MMDHFRVQHWPGGMSLSHSSWWISETRILNGVVVQIRVKFLKWADYK